ncbi:hypothetical protein [Coleofasciculus sp.]|uniref:hypothetical protein n=1 Tax=Coleofasciculus sp. TaxID=3100458 RepID=UPI003A407B60
MMYQQHKIPKSSLPMAQRATKKEAKGGVNVVQSRSEDMASPAKENRSVMAKSRDEMLNNVLQTLFKGANTNSDSVEFGIPKLQDESQLIAVAPAVVIPIGIGAYKLGSIVLASVGAAGTIIYWEDISGASIEIATIAIDWATDTVSEITDQIINAVSQAGVVAGNILERARGVIEGVIRNVLEARRGNTPGNNEAQNKQFKDAVREIERRIGRRLDRDEKQLLHQEISGQWYGFLQIVAIGIEMFGDTDAQEQIDDLVDWDDD